MMGERKMRRTTGVPRGILKFLVLRLLKQKPMSGVEIAEEIYRQTRERWKPSPGSIYPLLAWLQDKGYTEELPTSEEGLKRYQFTTRGIEFHENQVRFAQDFLKKLEFLVPMIIDSLHLDPSPEKASGIRKAAKRIILALQALQETSRNKLSEQTADEIITILTDCAKTLEQISQKMKEEN